MDFTQNSDYAEALVPIQNLIKNEKKTIADISRKEFNEVFINNQKLMNLLTPHWLGFATRFPQIQQVIPDFEHNNISPSSKLVSVFKSIFDATEEISFEEIIAAFRQTILTSNPPEERTIPIEQYKQLLKQQYKLFTTITGFFGPPIEIESEGVNLEITAKVKTRKENLGQAAMREISKSSEKESISEKPLEISVKDLFAPTKELFPKLDLDEDDSCPPLILIQGKAGVGKTSLSRFMCKGWSEGQIWNQFEWIFRLEIRELNQMKDLKLQDDKLWKWVYYGLFAQQPEQEFQLLWERIIEKDIEKKKVLFLLDGYDELPQSHSFKKSLTSLLSEKYSDCPKLITSRPHTNLKSVTPIKKRLIEITGFTNLSIISYIELYFDNNADSKKLLSFLKTNLGLWSIAHIPVNLNLICGIFETGFEQKKVQTITQLYHEMIEKLKERDYCNKMGIQSYSIGYTQKQEIAVHYVKVEKLISLIAYQALKAEDIIIPYSLISGAENEMKVDIKEAIQLGIIKPILNQNNPSKNYFEFVHLTLQEYFAAIYIADMYQNVYLKQMSLEQVENELLNYIYDPKFQIVCWFVAGILESKDLVLLKSFIDTLNNPKIIDIFGTIRRGLLLKCMEESYTTRTKELWKPILSKLQQHIHLVIDVNRYFFEKTKPPYWLDFIKSCSVLLQLTGEEDLGAKLNLQNMKSLDLVPSPRVVDFLLNKISTKMPYDEEIELNELLNTIRERIASLNTIQTLCKFKGKESLICQLASLSPTPEVLECLANYFSETKSLQAAEVLMTYNQNIQNILEVIQKKISKDAVNVLGKVAAKTHDVQVIQQLLKCLTHKDGEVRSAAEFQFTLGIDDAVLNTGFFEQLMKYLLHENKIISDSALSALQNILNRTKNLKVVEIVKNRIQDMSLKTPLMLLPVIISKFPNPELITQIEDRYNSWFFCWVVARLKQPTPKMMEKLINLLEDIDLHQEVSETLIKFKLHFNLPLFSKLIQYCKHNLQSIQLTASKVLISVTIGNSNFQTQVIEAFSAEYINKTTLQVLVRIFASCSSQLQARILETLGKFLTLEDLTQKVETLEVLALLGEAAATPFVLESVIQCLELAIQRKYSILFKLCSELLLKFKSKAAHPKIFSSFETILEHPEEKIRVIAVIKNIEAIGSAPNSIEGKLTKYLDFEKIKKVLTETQYFGYCNSNFVIPAIETLTVIGKATPNLISAIESLISSKHRPNIVIGLRALARLTVKEPTTQMLNLFATNLYHENRDSRSFTARILKNIAFKSNNLLSSVLEVLIVSLDKNNFDNSAWEALELIGEKAITKEVLDALLKFLRSENPVLRKRSFDVLSSFLQTATPNPQILQELAKCVSQRDKFIRKVAAETISKIGEKIKIPVVLEQFEKNLVHKDLEIVELTTDILARIIKINNSETLVKQLVLCLKHHNVSICTKATVVLAKLGGDIPVEIIDDLLLLMNNNYNQQIADALAAIGEKAAIPKVFNHIHTVGVRTVTKLLLYANCQEALEVVSICIKDQRSLSISVLQQIANQLPDEYEQYSSNTSQLRVRLQLAFIGDFIRGTSWGYVLDTKNPVLNLQTSGRRFCRILNSEILNIIKVIVENICILELGYNNLPQSWLGFNKESENGTLLSLGVNKLEIKD